MTDTILQRRDKDSVIAEIELQKKHYQSCINTIESSLQEGKLIPSNKDVAFGKKLAISVIEGMIVGCDITLNIIKNS